MLGGVLAWAIVITPGMATVMAALPDVSFLTFLMFKAAFHGWTCIESDLSYDDLNLLLRANAIKKCLKSTSAFSHSFISDSETQIFMQRQTADWFSKLKFTFQKLRANSHLKTF